MLQCLQMQQVCFDNSGAIPADLQWVTDYHSFVTKNVGLEHHAMLLVPINKVLLVQTP